MNTKEENKTRAAGECFIFFLSVSQPPEYSNYESFLFEANLQIKTLEIVSITELPETARENCVTDRNTTDNNIHI